ncbi:MAG: hypothetical protein DMH00_12240 [Acidobacteria bacterium]|nr:MAG: hypothetical protein DMH00_12240 [Acidobacteriota bacterium]
MAQRAAEGRAGERSKPLQRGSDALAPFEADKSILPASDHPLDTVGLYCPVPIIKTNARIRAMREGQVLEVISDDRVILLDMPAWCRSTGNEFLGYREDAGEIHLFVRKQAKKALPSGHEKER